VTATQLRDRPGSQDGGTDEHGGGRSRTGAGGRRRPHLRWRSWQLPALLILIVLLGAVSVALLTPQPGPNGYLDPASSTSGGANAITAILGERGFDVTAAYSPASALSAVRGAGDSPSSVTLVVTSPWLLTAAERRQLAGARADLFLVAPGEATLATLAPEARVKANLGAASGRAVQPSCGLTAARLAGSANVTGFAYDIPAGAIGCYPVGGYPSVVRYRAGGRIITILGDGAPLSNGYLASNGNAALSLNLLNGTRHIVWLVPEPATVPIVAGPSGGSSRATPALLPAGVTLLLLQLLVVVAFAAVWRGRRFGPLITEPLPVVVRASETVEGHARLYQSRRARDRAGGALRGAMLGRVLPALGLVSDTPAEAVSAELARRSRFSPGEVAAIVYGPPPGSDVEMVELARNLDELEREVRSQ
jgi:hypothetical protein